MLSRTAQPSHAAVNLPRLLRRLRERTAGLEKETWVEVRSGYQSVKHARELMKAVEEEGGLPAERLVQLHECLEKVEESFKAAVESHPIPSTSRLPLLSPPPLPTLSSLFPPSSPQPLTSETLSASAIPTLTSSESYNATREDDLLLPLLPSRQAGKDAGVGGYLGAAGLHEELGGQLADMSNRLKMNALHFATSLEEEKRMLETSQLVLENNLSKTRTSKTHLSRVSKKSRSTTCLIFGAVVAVMIAWVWTYMLIRFT